MQAKGIVTNIDKPFDFGPEIIGLEAQMQIIPTTLKVTAEFTNQGDDYCVTVLFKHIEGFRVLDEGDLLNFWGHENLPEEWIWEIISGGWYDDERKNENATILSTRVDQLTEYLVTGVGMCVSIICNGDERPIVTVLD